MCITQCLGNLKDFRPPVGRLEVVCQSSWAREKDLSFTVKSKSVSSVCTLYATKIIIIIIIIIINPYHYFIIMALRHLALPWSLFYFSFLILYTIGRTPWTGDKPLARPPPTHRTTQTEWTHTGIHASSGIRYHDLGVQVLDRSYRVDQDLSAAKNETTRSNIAEIYTWGSITWTQK
jgi:hypothetical protein